MSRLTLLLAIFPAVCFAVDSGKADCRGGDDPIMATHEGMMMLKEWKNMVLVARHDHDAGYEKYDCMIAAFTENDVFELGGIKMEEEKSLFLYNGSVSRYIDPLGDTLVFKVNYKDEKDENKFPGGLWHAGSEAFDMKIIYASKTEIVIEACHAWGSWPYWSVGSSRSAYVFSSQPFSVPFDELDEECMEEAVSKYAIVDYDLKMTNVSACLADYQELGR